MTIYMDDFIREMSNNGLHPNNVTYTPARQIRRFRVGGEKSGSKSGWYWLENVAGITYGAFGNWKTQLNVSYCSKSKTQFTAAERKAFDARQREHEQSQKIKQHNAALLAARIWQSAHPVTTHPYAERKQVSLHNLRHYLGKLIVPAYKNKEIVSLQFIAADGAKIFLKNGEMKGCFYFIAAPDTNWDIIYICEGYATGATIYEATSCPVIIAFTAGNLKAVAERVREKYTLATIIIAADNDRNTDGNPGVTAAGKAAQAVNGTVIVPQFIDDKSNDFNDLKQTEGIAEVKKQLSPPALAITTIDTDWKNYLIPGKYCHDDFPFPYDAKSRMNAYFFVQNIFPIFRYNEFCDEITITACPPWETETAFMPRRVKDSDFFMLSAHLERFGLRISSGDVYDVVVKLAHENAVNPPRDFFNTLKWDGAPRLDTWLTYYMGATEQPAQYLALVGSKWLIGAVSRIYRPGCKFDSVLIFEGSQGIGKSQALRALSTFNGQDYFLDSVGDIRNKDALMAMQGKIIIEMAELASLRKGDNEEIKGFISRQIDEYRPPYGRMTIRRPRYFVLAGTTNEITEGYLTDNTGNRRYWPVQCGSIDSDGLAARKYQLWAEAIHRYKLGECTWLSDDEVAHATREQESRMLVDAWQEKIDNILEGIKATTVDQVFERLGLGAKDINRISRIRICSCLERAGWTRSLISQQSGSKRVRGWRKEEK